MKLTRSLAENIVSTKYDVLPKEVVEKTKRHILDTLGVMFPPSTIEKACIALAEIASEMGGKPESTLVGFGGKVPCCMAAFVNGSLCHALDYEDIADELLHPSGPTFPAALAVAEKVETTSGQDLITAVALGIDLDLRLCIAAKEVIREVPWYLTTVFGVFSATAVAGKLLGLTDEEMVNAFGIAVDRAFGINETLFSPGSEIRAICHGFGSREGVLAALMAKKGITACQDAIEKLYKVFLRDSYDPSVLTSNLGTEFMGLRVSLKAWPCARPSHTFVQAALDIATEYKPDPAEIEEVVLAVGSLVGDRFFNPPEEKRRPKLSINAKLSLPFVMGVAFAKRRVTIEDFLPQNLGDSQVLEIADKVNYKVNPQLTGIMTGPGIVQVKTRDGRTLSKGENIVYAYGHPSNPISDEALIAKFKDCASYARNTLSGEKLDQLVDKLLTLERVSNIKEISQILT